MEFNSMKRILYVLMTVFTALVMTACDSGKGAGNATIGFEKTNYTYRENAGTVTVPVKFTGEPAEYPIRFSISASVDGSADINDVARFVQELSSLQYNGKGDVILEIELIDNLEPDTDRILTLEIASADGAEIVAPKTEILIQDNDGSLYDAIQGTWTFNCTSASSSSKIFEVKIDAGETSEDQEENKAKQRLRILGWDGNTYTDDTPPAPFEWYVFIRTDETTQETCLQTDPDTWLLRSTGDPLGIGVSPCEIYIGLSNLNEEGKINPDVTVNFDTQASISDDIRTITFNENIVMVPLIFSNGEYQDKYLDMYYHITLTR